MYSKKQPCVDPGWSQVVDAVINLSLIGNGNKQHRGVVIPLYELDEGALTDNNLLTANECFVRGLSSETEVSCLRS